jgi:hypothetical protein
MSKRLLVSSQGMDARADVCDLRSCPATSNEAAFRDERTNLWEARAWMPGVILTSRMRLPACASNEAAFMDERTN